MSDVLIVVSVVFGFIFALCVIIGLLSGDWLFDSLTEMDKCFRKCRQKRKSEQLRYDLNFGLEYHQQYSTNSDYSRQMDQIHNLYRRLEVLENELAILKSPKTKGKK